MTTVKGSLHDGDVAQVLLADRVVNRWCSQHEIPPAPHWRQYVEEAEAGELDDDPCELWWVRAVVAHHDYDAAVDAGRGWSDEVSRRFAGPMVATALARPDLPPVELQPLVENIRNSRFDVVGRDVWQAYYNGVTQVGRDAESVPEDAGRLIAIGDANWESRDEDWPNFLSALTAAGASERETEWLWVAAAAHQQGYDAVRLESQAHLQRFMTPTPGVVPGGVAVSPGDTALSEGTGPTTASSRPRQKPHMIG